MSSLVKKTESFKYQERVLCGMRAWSDSDKQELRERYPTVPNKVIADEMNRTEPSIASKARVLGLSKNRRASRMYETRQEDADYPRNDDAFANYVCGFVDGEGSFVKRVNGDEHSFTFCVEVVEDDDEIIQEIKDFLGVGTVYYTEATVDGWQDHVQYQVNDADALARTIIPFFKHYGLRAELKKKQFNEFDEEFHDYFNLEPKALYGDNDNN